MGRSMAENVAGYLVVYSVRSIGDIIFLTVF
jgi:hypothetical protein